MKLKYTVRVAQEEDALYAASIAHHIAIAAADPSNGICKRSEAVIQQKMQEQDAVIAITNNQKWAGFCYLQKWKDNFVSTCGLIIHPRYRSGNIGRQIKETILQLAQEKYPGATLFGLTTSAAVMKINTRLGYRPVTYSMITQDENFWDSCKGCSNHGILKLKQGKNCLCTAMILETLKETK